MCSSRTRGEGGVGVRWRAVSVHRPGGVLASLRGPVVGRRTSRRAPRPPPPACLPTNKRRPPPLLYLRLATPSGRGRIPVLHCAGRQYLLASPAAGSRRATWARGAVGGPAELMTGGAGLAPVDLRLSSRAAGDPDRAFQSGPGPEGTGDAPGTSWLSGWRGGGSG